MEEKTFHDWVQWKMANQSKNVVYLEYNADSEYQQNKSSLYVAGSNQRGADNLGFVQDENGLSFNGHSSHDLKGSFRKPKLLSSRQFDDNY